VATALVLGANGQDGTFLTKHLLSKSYRVIGVGRQQSCRWAISSLLYTYYQLDLRQTQGLAALLQTVRPDIILHVAAAHNSAEESDETLFNDMLQVNVASVHTILEYLRLCNQNGRLMYASSGKVFGDPYPPIIDETTPMSSSCLYTTSKITAFHLIDYYRCHYSLQASTLFLFNHESVLRPQQFFIPRILQCVASAKDNEAYVGSVLTLDFFCDWGSAEEYMDLAIDIAEKAPNDDFVIATGTCIYARDFVRDLFLKYGLDYRRHIQEKTPPGIFLNSFYQVNLTKLQQKIGRIPRIGIAAVCTNILDEKLNGTACL
jgi:GDPmannose 4,6-dehydratase